MSTKKQIYTGQRKPRDDDPEKWAIYYEKHPELVPETAIEPEPEPEPEKETVAVAKPQTNTAWSFLDKRSLTARQKTFMEKLVGLVAWSPLLGATMLVKNVTADRNKIDVTIVKQVTMTLDEFVALDAEHFGTASKYGKKYKEYITNLEATNVTAFRDFHDSLSIDKKTSILDWMKSEGVV